MSDTRDFMKLFLWQAKRHADILATILARMSTRMSVSVSWNAGLDKDHNSDAAASWILLPRFISATAVAKVEKCADADRIRPLLGQ